MQHEHDKPLPIDQGSDSLDNDVQCPTCKSKFTEFVLVAIRDISDRVTVKCNCLDCNSRWKFDKLLDGAHVAVNTGPLIEKRGAE